MTNKDILQAISAHAKESFLGPYHYLVIIYTSPTTVRMECEGVEENVPSFTFDIIGPLKEKVAETELQTVNLLDKYSKKTVVHRVKGYIKDLSVISLKELEEKLKGKND